VQPLQNITLNFGEKDMVVILHQKQLIVCKFIILFVQRMRERRDRERGRVEEEREEKRKKREKRERSKRGGIGRKRE
jgi:hypothetical protein